MNTDCPECGASLVGTEILDDEGDQLSGPAGHTFLPLDMGEDGELRLTLGVSCDECEFEQVVKFEPEVVDNDPNL